MQYDVVVIGGGSAGCVLATRLTEDSQRSVLLLEAGPDYPDLERYPDDLKYGYDQTASAVDAPHNWSFVGTPTPQQGTIMPVPRGKVVGGSSAINGQVFSRGVPEDYDNWAALGNDEWTFQKVLPYFKKAETDTDIQITGCKFSVAQMLRSSAQIEGNRIRREQCAKRNAWDFEPAKDTDMRVIVMFSGPCAADALTARGSVFSHDFKGLE